MSSSPLCRSIIDQLVQLFGPEVFLQTAVTNKEVRDWLIAAEPGTDSQIIFDRETTDSAGWKTRRTFVLQAREGGTIRMMSPNQRPVG